MWIREGCFGSSNKMLILRQRWGSQNVSEVLFVRNVSERTDLEILGCCALWARFAGLCDFVLQYRSCPMWCSERDFVYSFLLILGLNPATHPSRVPGFIASSKSWLYSIQLLWASGVFVQPGQTETSSKTPFYNQDTCSVMHRKLYFRALKHSKELVDFGMFN